MRDVAQQILRPLYVSHWRAAGLYRTPRLNGYVDGIQIVGDCAWGRANSRPRGRGRGERRRNWKYNHGLYIQLWSLCGVASIGATPSSNPERFYSV